MTWPEQAQQVIRSKGMCGELLDGGRLVCIKPPGHPPPHGEGAPDLTVASSVDDAARYTQETYQLAESNRDNLGRPWHWMKWWRTDREVRRRLRVSGLVTRGDYKDAA